MPPCVEFYVLRNTLGVSAAILGAMLLCVAVLDWIGYDAFIRALSVQ